MVNKILLKSQEEFDNFLKDHTGYQPGYGNVSGYDIEDGPELYPCVLVWHIEFNDAGPDFINGDFVYIKDFLE